MRITPKSLTSAGLALMIGLVLASSASAGPVAGLNRSSAPVAAGPVTDQEEDDVDAALGELNDAGLAKNWESDGTLAPVLQAPLDKAFPDVWSGVALDREAHTVIVHYAETAPAERLEAFFAAVDRLREQRLPWEIKTEGVPWTESEARHKVAEILDDDQEWAARQGVRDITMVGVSSDFSSIWVGTSDDNPAQPAAGAIGFPLEVVSARFDEQVSHWTDAKPLAAGPR
ncbi:MAG: hypothetical protein LBK95_06390 [Bifidobacteriaceae bacterium]|nr:hypothetical protein [Bifidobacteriaceae bacterium]